MGTPVLKYDEETDHPDVYNAAGLKGLSEEVDRIDTDEQIEKEYRADLKERNALEDLHQDDDDSTAETGYSEKT